MRVLLEIAGDQDDLAGGVLHIEDILKAGGSSVPASAWLTLARLYVEVARGETPPAHQRRDPQDAPADSISKPPPSRRRMSRPSPFWPIPTATWAARPRP